MTEPVTGIVIPTGENFDQLHNCLTTLYTVSKLPCSRFHVRLALSGTSDDTEQRIREWTSWYSNLSIGRYEPFHFASVCNRAEQDLPEDVNLLLFMNDDTALINDCLTLISSFFESAPPACGTVGARLHYKTGLIQHAGQQIIRFEDDSMRAAHRGHMSQNLFKYCSAVPVLGNTAAFMAISRSLFRQLDGFPTHYTDESEDLEFNVRAMLAGRTNWNLGYASAYHYETQTRTRDDETIARAEAERKTFLYPLVRDNEGCATLQRAVTDFDRTLKQHDWGLDRSRQLQSEFEAGSFFIDVSNPEQLAKQRKFEDRTDLDSYDGKLHILFVGKPGGCGRARCETPAKYLNREPGIAAFPTSRLLPELVEWAHLFVWHQPAPPSFRDIRNPMLRYNVPQVADVDDNCFELSPYNPSKSGVMAEEVEEWLRACGWVTVVREELGNFYRSRIDSIETITMPNCIDFELVPPEEPRPEGPVRLLWAGGRSHYEDLLTVVPALMRLQRTYGDRLEIHILGWDGQLPENFGLPSVFSNLNVYHTPSVPPDEYFRTIRSLHPDFGIIPLADMPFNRTGKSQIKFLEYSALHVPAVVSRMPLYDEAEDGERALRAGPEDEWEAQIARMIEEPDLRRYIAENAYKYAGENYDMADHAKYRAAIYARIAATKYTFELTT